MHTYTFPSYFQALVDSEHAIRGHLWGLCLACLAHADKNCSAALSSSMRRYRFANAATRSAASFATACRALQPMLMSSHLPKHFSEHSFVSQETRRFVQPLHCLQRASLKDHAWRHVWYRCISVRSTRFWIHLQTKTHTTLT